MDVLLRRIELAADGRSSAADAALAVDRITVGSAAECTIQLVGRAVAPLHAYINGSEGRARIRCVARCRMTVNGKSLRSATLAVGDAAEISGHRLTILTPPAGFDVAIEVRPDPTIGVKDYEKAFRTELTQTWLSARLMSWTLIFAVLALGLISPLWMIHRHRAQQPTVRGLPDDALWSSGPLTSAHAHAAGRKCDSCHQAFFSPVQDGACRECHKDSNDHVSKARRALASLEDSKRCGECHREHVGELARAVIRDDHLCVGCHADADRKFAALKVTRVTGFEKSAHPAFDVQLSKLGPHYDPAADDYQWISYRTPLRNAREASNLEFKHAHHLDSNRVTRLDTGEPLGCSDCHKLNSADRFAPITMATSCASCHKLVFDAGAPDRQLPHGDAPDAIAVIEDYFNKKYTDPPPKTLRVVKSPLPDHLLDPGLSMDVDPCQGPPIPCARARAKAAIEIQFNDIGCKLCHTVDPIDTPDIHKKYHIRPVRLGSSYFPDLKFSHKTHQVQGDLSGDAACESCHAARDSQSSSQLLLPDVEKCLSCHRDLNGAGAITATATVPRNGASIHVEADKVVTLQCTSCHEYHPAASLIQAHRTEQ
jgi:predicted CXXCH cytochrome family protein